jgi:uncharacterized protein YndB with AHSA1/START domain
MSKSLIVKHSIRIEATPNRVWEVLTKPQYIRQWGFLPEDFGDFEISPTTILEYPDRRLNVLEFNPNTTLRYSLYVPTWEEEVTSIGYTYALSADAQGHTWLSVEIGDFAILVEGDKYYGESTIFGETASHKIKALAEKRQIAL